MKLSIIGLGNLGGALARRFLEVGVARSDLQVISRGSSKSKQICNEIDVVPCHSLDCSESDVIVLAVKPQDVFGVGSELAGRLPESAVLLSMMAGVSCDALRSIFRHPVVARAMPNLGVVSGESATSYFIPPDSLGQKDELENVLRMCGPIFRVEDESLLEVSTAVAGSGPAYVCWLAEQLQLVAERNGFNSEQARAMVLQTLRGTLAYLEGSGEEFGSLIQKVSSPNGTTARAFSVLGERDATNALVQSIDAARIRAAELAIPSKD